MNGPLPRVLGRLGRLCAVAAVALLAACVSLPPLEPRPQSFARTDTADTPLGRAAAALAAAHPGRTGIHAMPLATDAFAARMVFARLARATIDAQYYIWHGDQTGLLLLDALAQAARSGVRVRLLLDDQNTRDLEDVLAALDGQPNIEVRLYNPFAHRGARFLDYLGDFERVNRRMHNKSFIVDNQVAVVGGRNIGNEYFGAGNEIPFKDLDVIVVGPVVPDISAQFDRYWNSASAYPAAAVVGRADAPSIESARARLEASHGDPASTAYLDAVRATPLLDALVGQRLALEWAEARLVYDDPAKTLDPDAGAGVLLLSALLDDRVSARRSLDIISPYFVPAERGTATLAARAGKGVRIRVLTNSLAATDVAIVHSGYAKRRCELARAGVQLFELKPEVADPQAVAKPRKEQSSAARLHAKTFAADGERIFVGSFNFDPRSALLNTEMGLVIESPALAARLASTFEEVVPANAYEVRARPEGECIEWIERTAAGEVRHATEPNSGWGRRAWLGFLTLLPLDPLL